MSKYLGCSFGRLTFSSTYWCLWCWVVPIRSWSSLNTIKSMGGITCEKAAVEIISSVHIYFRSKDWNENNSMALSHPLPASLNKATSELKHTALLLVSFGVQVQHRCMRCTPSGTGPQCDHVSSTKRGPRLRTEDAVSCYWLSRASTKRRTGNPTTLSVIL